MAGSTEWVAAWIKAATWGQAVAVGADSGVKLESESMPSMAPGLILDENVGDRLTGATFQGNREGEGNLVFGARYEGLERILALLMGLDTVNTIEALLSFEHVLTFEASNTGKFGTLVLDKGLGALGSDVHEYPTVKPSSVEFAHTEGKLMATFGMIPNSCERDSTAQVNDATSLGNVTNPTSGLLALFNQLDFRIVRKTGSEGNLSASNNIGASETRFSVNRNLSGDVVTSSSGEIDEPETDGLPTAQLVTSFPQYLAAIDDPFVKEFMKLQADRVPVEYKAQLIWTGPDIPGTAGPDPYRIAIDIPSLVVESAPTNAGSPGAKVPVETTFRVQTPQAVVDGSEWAWVVANGDPFRIRIQNGNSASMS